MTTCWCRIWTKPIALFKSFHRHHWDHLRAKSCSFDFSGWPSWYIFIWPRRDFCAVWSEAVTSLQRDYKQQQLKKSPVYFDWLIGFHLALCIIDKAILRERHIRIRYKSILFLNDSTNRVIMTRTIIMHSQKLQTFSNIYIWNDNTIFAFASSSWAATPCDDQMFIYWAEKLQITRGPSLDVRIWRL